MDIKILKTFFEIVPPELIAVGALLFVVVLQFKVIWKLIGTQTDISVNLKELSTIINVLVQSGSNTNSRGG